LTSVVISCVFTWTGIDRAALGVLGAGQRLAQELSGRHTILILGSPSDDLVAEVARFADCVQVMSDPMLANYHSETTLTALTEACRQLNPAVILLGNDSYCQEMAPRLAHRLKGSATGDALSLKAEGEAVLVTRSVYGGKALATFALRRKPAVIWVRARAYDPARPQDASAEIVHMQLKIEEDQRVVLIDRQTQPQDAARLEDARVIVSGGRGLGGPEPFTHLQSLASAMGAQVAASRAACDAGWVPAGWQVGQTGKKVAPELYLAIAISGASQHIMGIADAKTIAAINLDPDAPIFHHCQFGLVDDYRKVVGPLREKIIELLA